MLDSYVAYHKQGLERFAKNFLLICNDYIFILLINLFKYKKFRIVRDNYIKCFLVRQDNIIRFIENRSLLYYFLKMELLVVLKILPRTTY